jgi:ligand-binding sensor domain-containing protein
MYCGLVLKMEFLLQNGEFSIINESNGLGHNSCWDISQDIDGNMWFASYGGGVSKFDGQSFTVLLLSRAYLRTRQGSFFLKVKCMLVLNRAFL